LLIETSPEIDAYLQDHVLDGTPVMPAAVAMELMAEAAAAHSAGLTVTRVSDVRVLQGITYPDGRPRSLAIEVTDAPTLTASTSRVGVSIKSTGTLAVHYRADVTVQRSLGSGPRIEPLRLAGSRSVGLSVSDIYQHWLFHGPRLQGIAAVHAVGDNGIVGRLRRSAPGQLLGVDVVGKWLMDPLVVDSALQLLIVWARTYLDQTPLPSRLGCYHRYAGVLPSEILCEAEVDHRPPSSTLRCQLRLLDDDRRLVGWLEDMEVTCSQSLNRLSQSVAARAGV
jgi:hypothetical protein